MLFGSAGADWTQKGDIGQRALDQEGCAREAGALVRCITNFRDMNVAVPAADERAIEVLGVVLTRQAETSSARTSSSEPAIAVVWWSWASKQEADGAGRQD